MKVLFTGGGSGGHLFPIIAIIREIKENYPRIDFSYIGPKDSFAKNLFSVALIRFESRERGPVIVMFDKFPFKVDSEFDEKTLLMKMAIFYLTAVAGGTSYSCGLYGPLPVTGHPNYESLVYTEFVKDPKNTDPRLKGKNYLILSFLYHKKLAKLFSLQREKIEKIFKEHISPRMNVYNISIALLEKIYNDLEELFSSN